MDKKWFKTRNNSILDLNVFDSFHSEHTPWNREFTVFASIKGNENAYPMAIFQCKEESQEYIDEIYQFLGKNETEQT